MDVGYLSMDSLLTGVGRSQVLPYIERLAAAGAAMTLYSFEPQTGADVVPDGFEWRRLRFGGHGAAAGLGRVVRAAIALERHDVVHARSDMSAAAVMCRRHRRWVWDMRSFWVDQRLAMGAIRPWSPEVLAMRGIEHRAAKEATAVIVLSNAAADVMVRRHGTDMKRKLRVISTCVDLKRFGERPLPSRDVLDILLSGTMNTFYDAARITELCRELARRTAVRVRMLVPPGSAAAHAFEGVATSFGGVPYEEMPQAVASAHVGMSVCRSDAGVSLTAAVPTKIAEFLSVGRPVVVNRGLGDMDAIISEFGCGVVLGDDRGAVARAAAELIELLNDPEVTGRCRDAATRHFDLDRGVAALSEIYHEVPR